MPTTTIEHVACITGGRYDENRQPRRPTERQMFCFERLITRLGIREVWDGNAIGTDRFVRNWIERRTNPVLLLHITCKTCPVDTSMDGPWPAAGHRRNRRMLTTSQASKLIGFPGDKGTNGCIQDALRTRLEVWQWSDDAQDFVRIDK